MVCKQFLNLGAVPGMHIHNYMRSVFTQNEASNTYQIWYNLILHMDHAGTSDLPSSSLATTKLILNSAADIDSRSERSKGRHFLGASLSQRILPEYVTSAKGNDGRVAVVFSELCRRVMRVLALPASGWRLLIEAFAQQDPWYLFKA